MNFIFFAVSHSQQLQTGLPNGHGISLPTQCVLLSVLLISTLSSETPQKEKWPFLKSAVEHKWLPLRLACVLHGLRWLIGESARNTRLDQGVWPEWSTRGSGGQATWEFWWWGPYYKGSWSWGALMTRVPLGGSQCIIIIIVIYGAMVTAQHGSCAGHDLHSQPEKAVSLCSSA